MKTITIAAFILALLAMPAHAQGRRQQGGGEETRAKQDTKPKVDEKAYKAALERIPDPKQKYDPWGGVAPAQTAAPAAPAKKK